MKSVIVVIGAGSIGQAIARRVGAGKHVLLSDLRQDNADAAARTLADAGFDVSTATVDVSSRASVQAPPGGTFASPTASATFWRIRRSRASGVSCCRGTTAATTPPCH